MLSVTVVETGMIGLLQGHEHPVIHYEPGTKYEVLIAGKVYQVDGSKIGKVVFVSMIFFHMFAIDDRTWRQILFESWFEAA